MRVPNGTGLASMPGGCRVLASLHVFMLRCRSGSLAAGCWLLGAASLQPLLTLCSRQP